MVLKSSFYSKLIVALAIIHSIAEAEFNSYERAIVKRACVPLGGLCNSADDCCAAADPDSGHCVGCWKHGSSIIPWGKSRCSCDATDSVAIDPATNTVVSDMCHGHDKAKTRCVTRLAPPSHRFYRGNKLFW